MWAAIVQGVITLKRQFEVLFIEYTLTSFQNATQSLLYNLKDTELI